MIFPNELDRVCEDACEAFGLTTQEQIAIGELGELLALFGKRAQGRDNHEQWIDEIADGLIVLHQLAYLHGKNAVEDRIKVKLPSLQARIRISADFQASNHT